MKLGSGVLAVALLGFGAEAARAEVFGKRSGILDEYNLDVYRGAETARVAAGLTFGDVTSSSTFGGGIAIPLGDSMQIIAEGGRMSDVMPDRFGSGGEA